jgi:hypothetical protein
MALRRFCFTPMFMRAGLAVSLLLSLAWPVATQSAIDPAISSKVLAAVSEERLASIVRKLESFGTRHTLSKADDPSTGIGAARQWIHDELQRSNPKLQVSFETHQVPKGRRITADVELRNVVAVLPGRSPRRIYLTAHYDSLTLQRRGTPADPNIAAPGANDDGSGTALVMEAARVLAASGLEFDATLVFALFAGEEQGLIGARLHAKNAAAEKVPIDAFLNNDIVGNIEAGDGTTDTSSVRVFAGDPADSPARALARYIKRNAARYFPSHRVRLMARSDRFGRGGDHLPFWQLGFAAVRLNESRENYARQHTPEDRAEFVSPPYLAQNTRVNLAAAASLALAPPAPNVFDTRGPRIRRGGQRYDAQLEWAPSSGATTYRIFWRESWSNDWQHEKDVGPVTAFILPKISIDEHVFGVAAIGPYGHESLVSAYVTPQRQSNQN